MSNLAGEACRCEDGFLPSLVDHANLAGPNVLLKGHEGPIERKEVAEVFLRPIRVEKGNGRERKRHGETTAGGGGLG